MDKKIIIPFTLEQFRDAIERIKADFEGGNLLVTGKFEIETLEYYYEVLEQLNDILFNQRKE